MGWSQEGEVLPIDLKAAWEVWTETDEESASPTEKVAFFSILLLFLLLWTLMTPDSTASNYNGASSYSGASSVTSLQEGVCYPDVYKVAPGDTLDAIARECGYKNYLELLPANPLKQANPNQLAIGEVINLPDKNQARVSDKYAPTAVARQ